MNIEPTYLIYGVVFIAGVLLVEGLYYFFTDVVGGQRATNRRMRMLSSGRDAYEVLHKLRRDQSEGPDASGLDKLIGSLGKLIVEAGVPLKTPQLLAIMAAACVVATGGVFYLLMRHSAAVPTVSPFLVAGTGGIAIGTLGPLIYLQYLKAQRLKLFGEQLPDALDMMVRSLRAGHPVNVSLSLVAKQMPDPMGTEFGIAVDEITYGLELREALENVGRRVPLQDYQYVVVAISIQHETGGNLAEVLSGLSSVIRARFRMFKKIRALAAEGRFSMKILSVLPVAFAWFTYSIRPNYYLAVVDDPLFFKIFGTAVVLQICGILVMKKMINFHV